MSRAKGRRDQKDSGPILEPQPRRDGDDNEK